MVPSPVTNPSTEARARTSSNAYRSPSPSMASTQKGSTPRRIWATRLLASPSTMQYMVVRWRPAVEATFLSHQAGADYLWGIGADVPQTSRRRPAGRVSGPVRPAYRQHMTLADWAETTARDLLADPLPRRWAHTQGVAATARTLASLLGADAGLLLAAAWLHDIGYS